MPSYNRITDTSEIKNDINGFDLVECFKTRNVRIYLSFPNLGPGMLAHTAASAHKGTRNLELGNNYTYSQTANKDQMIDTENKKTRFKPYSGMTREMFVSSVDMVTGCGNNNTLSSSLNLCIPWKVYSINDVSEYMTTSENNIITSGLTLDNSDNTKVFDYYMNTLNMAREVISGNTGLVEELSDGIAASIIRYATAGVDILVEEEEDTIEGEITSYYPPETKWARPYFTGIPNYTPYTTRAEYTDLFSEERGTDIYFKKIAEGITDTSINDVFVKPCVMFSVDGENQRLFYSKQLSDKILESIRIEGASSPAVVEYNRVINIYGDENTPELNYINRKLMSNMESELDITLEEYDKLTGSGYDILQHMVGLCENTSSIHILDWPEGQQQTTLLKDTELVLTTPRPPVFSMGEAYIAADRVDPSNPPAKLPFHYSYIVPSESSGYIDEDMLSDTDFLGFGYYPGEGYNYLVEATSAYLNLLSEFSDEAVKPQCPSPYPVNSQMVQQAASLSSWRVYLEPMVSITNGIVSGNPISPASGNVFIPVINNLPLPSIEKIGFDDIVTMPDDSNIGTDEWIQQMGQYTEYLNLVTANLKHIEEYRKKLFQYNGPETNISAFDYGQLHPILISDEATAIKAQDLETVGLVEVKPDTGVGTYKNPEHKYKSMSSDPTVMRINESTGAVDISAIFRKNSLANEHDKYVGKTGELLSVTSRLISEVKNYIDNTLLVISDTKTLPNGNMYPVFGNCDSNLSDAWDSGFLNNTVLSSMMYIATNETENESNSYNDSMSTMLSLWDMNSSGLIAKVIDASSNNNTVKIRKYANMVRINVLDPTRVYCQKIAEAIVKKKPDNSYSMYYRDGGTEDHGYVIIPQGVQNMGVWFYNVRKAYLLMISLLSLVESMCDGIDTYLVAIMNDYSPFAIDMEPAEGESSITTSFDTFAFLDGDTPVYPILKNDISIGTIPGMYLNRITKLSAVENSFIYNLKISFDGMDEIEDNSAVMMPGFGIRNKSGVTDSYFWNQNSLFETGDGDDDAARNTPFLSLQNGISHDDYVSVSNDQLLCMDYAQGGNPVSVARQVVEDTIKGTSVTIPEIPSMTITGVIDAGFIFPFYDQDMPLKINTLAIDVLYYGMNPVTITDSISYLPYTISDIDQTIDPSKLTKEINNLAGAKQNNENMFAMSVKEVTAPIQMIADKVTSMLTPSYLDALYSGSDDDIDFGITIFSHSFARSRIGDMTNSILQGYLVPASKTSSGIQALLSSPASIATELKGTSYWKNYFTQTGTSYKRNFNNYLSKRRSHYTSYLVYLSIINTLASKGDEYLVTRTTYGGNEAIRVVKENYRITFALSDTKPEGRSFKMFNTYGFGGLFLDVDTENVSTNFNTDINNSVRSQVKLSNNIYNTRDMAYTNNLQGSHDRVRYSVNFNSDMNTGKVTIPENSFLFPDDTSIINTKDESGKYPYRIITEWINKNYESTSTLTADELFNPGNIKQTKAKVLEFMAGHLDSFRIDSFIDKLWVIIELNS